MIRIRFADDLLERRALGFLVGRFSFKTFVTGETLVPEVALVALAREGISYIVEGPASYAQVIPTIRDARPRKIQRRRARSV